MKQTDLEFRLGNNLYSADNLIKQIILENEPATYNFEVQEQYYNKVLQPLVESKELELDIDHQARQDFIKDGLDNGLETNWIDKEGNDFVITHDEKVITSRAYEQFPFFFSSTTSLATKLHDVAEFLAQNEYPNAMKIPSDLVTLIKEYEKKGDIKKRRPKH